MITFNGLPLYRATLAQEGDGVLRVSLVDDPAVQSNFDVFSKAQERKTALYAIQDEEKRLVRGVVLRADFPMFRKDNDQDPGYYVTFGREDIRKIAERYLADGRQNAVDTDHDGQEVEGVRMVQYFLKDSAAGIAPEGFDDIADGSLFAEYHVTNDDVWNEIKDGTWKGFSVEIFYTLIPAEAMAREEDDRDAVAVVRLLRRLIHNCTDMSKLANLRARLARILAEFGSVTTDKGVIHWDGEDDLKAGDSVWFEDEDGNRVDAQDGDYVTADGKTIVVVDGKVSEIRDPEAEVAPAEEETETQAEESAALRRFNAIRAAFDESFEDKEKAIREAIYATRESDDPWYLYEAGDDFAVIATWDEETYKERFFRYDIAWNEDGTAVASNPTEVELEFVPADAPEAAEGPSEEEFEQAVQAAAGYKAEIATLQARIAELEATPAGPSAKEKYNRNEGGPLLSGSTGDKGLDRLARIRK